MAAAGSEAPAGAVLALDVGTSSCRASLYDTHARRLPWRSEHVGHTVETTPDGGAELDARRLLKQLREAIDVVLKQPHPPLLAVASATFWHSLLGLDAHGEPCTPLFLWMDARSREQARALRTRLDPQAVHERTGCTVHWSYWPAKLMWLRETRPDALRGTARWVSFGEYLVEQWTGQRAVSVSMASATGLLNQHTLTWDAEMLDTLELSPDTLSPIVSLHSTETARGEALVRWPALRGVPWLPAVGDGAASNLGAGCTTPDRFALMVGTSGAERVVWCPSELRIPAGTWCYRVDERRVVLGGALNDGGSLLDWLRRTLQLPGLAESETELAGIAPDSHGLTVLPFWAGERSPGWADDARGAVFGLRLHTRPIDMLRASLEAIALRFGELDRILLAAMPSGREIVATGGALLHSPAWLQIMADVLGRPVLASAEPEASSHGVSLLALETLGLLDHPLESITPDVRRRYDPLPEHTRRYAGAAERQRQLYERLVG